MTQEEKQILIADLCARLPYGLMVEGTFAEMNWDTNEIEYKTEKKLLGMGDLDWLFHDAAEIKPYLRPMSSMTMKEHKEFDKFCVIDEDAWRGNMIEGHINQAQIMSDGLNWLIARRFDYRGWTDDGKAYKAPDGMYDFVASFHLEY